MIYLLLLIAHLVYCLVASNVYFSINQLLLLLTLILIELLQVYLSFRVDFILFDVIKFIFLLLVNELILFFITFLLFIHLELLLMIIFLVILNIAPLIFLVVFIANLFMPKVVIVLY